MADGKRARVLDFFIAIDCKKAASQTDGASDPRPSETAQKLHKRGWRERERERVSAEDFFRCKMVKK